MTFIPNFPKMAALRTYNLFFAMTQYRYNVYLIRRSYSSQRGFLGSFIENIKQEYNKNKEIKENLKKFREEAEKLEHSEAMQKARQKYQTLEAETSRSSQQIYKHLGTIKEKLKEGLDEVQKSELGKKGKELGDGFAKTVQGAAESIAKQTEQLGKISTFKVVKEGMQAVGKEIEEGALSHGARIYRPPEKLIKRKDRSIHAAASPDSKTFEPNMDESDIVIHKDSRWYQSWQKFKDKNAYFNKLFDLKAKYDESENPLIRASRFVTEKVSDVCGGLFKKTELSEVLTEITKIDPSFDKEAFIKECELEIIPNILEAIVQGNLEILNDWCMEGVYNVLSEPIKQAQAQGCKFESRILDIDNVDIITGQLVEDRPVLFLSFQAQQILCLQDSKGKIIQGSKDEVMRVHYRWALCRDPTELDPKVAWKLMDLGYTCTKQFL